MTILNFFYWQFFIQICANFFSLFRFRYAAELYYGAIAGRSSMSIDFGTGPVTTTTTIDISPRTKLFVAVRPNPTCRNLSSIAARRNDRCWTHGRPTTPFPARPLSSEWIFKQIDGRPSTNEIRRGKSVREFYYNRLFLNGIFLSHTIIAFLSHRFQTVFLSFSLSV